MVVLHVISIFFYFFFRHVILFSLSSSSNRYQKMSPGWLLCWENLIIFSKNSPIFLRSLRQVFLTSAFDKKKYKSHVFFLFLFAERNEVERSVLAIPVFFNLYLYFNERYFWITSMWSCSVYLARQIDIKKCDPDGFFA